MSNVSTKPIKKGSTLSKRFEYLQAHLYEWQSDHNALALLLHIKDQVICYIHTFLAYLKNRGIPSGPQKLSLELYFVRNTAADLWSDDEDSERKFIFSFEQGTFYFLNKDQFHQTEYLSTFSQLHEHEAVYKFCFHEHRKQFFKGLLDVAMQQTFPCGSIERDWVTKDTEYIYMWKGQLIIPF